MIKPEAKMQKIFNDILITLFFLVIGLTVIGFLKAPGSVPITLLGIAVGLPLASFPLLKRFLKFGLHGILDFTMTYRDAQAIKPKDPSEISRQTLIFYLAVISLLGVFISLIKVAVLTISWIEQALKSKGPLGLFTPMNVPLILIIAFFLYIFSNNYTNSLAHSIETERSTSDLSSDEVITELKDLKSNLDKADYSYTHPLKTMGRNNVSETDNSCTMTLKHLASDNSWLITVKVNDIKDYFSGIKNGVYILDPGEYHLHGNSFTFEPYFTDEDYSNDTNLQKSPATVMQKTTLLKKLTVDGMLNWSGIDRLTPRDLFASPIEGNDTSNYELSYKKSAVDSEQYLVFRLMKTEDSTKLVSISRGYKNASGFTPTVIDINDISYE